MQSWQEKNQTNYWCDYCNQFVRNNPTEKKKHETTPKHKYSVQNYAKNKKKQDEFMNHLKNPSHHSQKVQQESQQKPHVKNISVEQQKKAIQRQEQFDQFYSTSKVSSNVSSNIPIHLLQHVEEEGEGIREYHDPPISTELTKSLEEVKKKQQEFDDDYYDNPDFFYTEESEQVDSEKLKKEEEEIRSKIALTQRNKEEEEMKKKQELERLIQRQEYEKRMDQSTGLGKWEEVEEVEIEEPMQEIHQEEMIGVSKDQDPPSNTSSDRAQVAPVEYSHGSTSSAKKRKMHLLESLLENDCKKMK